jgi:hypothetical protein
MMRTQVSVLIPTCDAYSDCWEGLGLSWEVLSGLDLEIFVVSDSKLFDYPHRNFVPLSIQKPDFTPFDFSTKIVHALKNIKTKYVLMMCDDMWPDRSVKDIMPRFLEFIENERADCLRIHEKLYWWEYHFEMTDHFIEGERVLRMKQDSTWLLTHNAAIWNVEYLQSIQAPGEDPWNNEIAGTERAKRTPHKQYHYNMRWYLQHHNFFRGRLLPYGEAFIRNLKYKKEFNREFSIRG